MVIAAREIIAGSLSAFVMSDHMHFQDGFAFEEPADVETINQAGYETLCRDRHYHIRGEDYDAVIRVNGVPGGYYVARLAPRERPGLLRKLLWWFRTLGQR